jgi:uncharacterized membrane protein
MADNFDEEQKKLFLDLMSHHTHAARKEGAIAGVLYGVVVVVLLGFDFWRRLMRKP